MSTSLTQHINIVNTTVVPPCEGPAGEIGCDFDRVTRFATVATCSLNQWAMDFDGNYERIARSIREAKAKGARIRLGPELEVSGYNCEDHYFESDTIVHCWETMEKILNSDLTDGILCDIGMPVLNSHVRYNCRVICLDRKILLIRPKMSLADEGNYRESRWFTEWSKGYTLDMFYLPRNIAQITGQVQVPFGVGIVRLADSAYACEICEEIFTAKNASIDLGLAGAEIIGNGSGSHHTLRKRARRLELMQETTKKNGGVYMYANMIGCDGNRLYFDGTSSVFANGKMFVLGKQFGITECEVVACTLSLLDVWNFRASIASRGVQASQQATIPRVEALHFQLSTPRTQLITPPTLTLAENTIISHSEEEEVALAGSCWLWDYLRRSGLPGYFLPLSGGADSGGTAALVGIMCQNVVERIKEGDETTIKDVQKITRDPTYKPTDAKELCSRIFYCVYMATKNSSADTLERATSLSKDLGCTFYHTNIDSVCSAFADSFESMTGMRPDLTHLDSQENIACQNIQARSRMVLAYECAQLLLCTRPENKGKKWPGTLLVLGSANLDEAYRGYYTKYDCSAADINPIGGVGKVLLKKFLLWAAETRHFPTLERIVNAKASAELQPTTEGGKQAQISEDEMGLTFEELHTFGKLRVHDRCGPLLMYHKLRDIWPERTPTQIADKVKKFCRYYAINRHKVCILPPSLHMEQHGCDDNRYDLRQILYNVAWPRQFREIEQAVRIDERDIEAAKKQQQEEASAAASASASAAQATTTKLVNFPTASPMLRSPSTATAEMGSKELQEAIALLQSSGFTISRPTMPY